jgi:hypothetical protein
MRPRKPRACPEHASADVIDDATRSLSVRISVLDYGRIRVLARQLRVRESVATRLLLGLGLGELSALYVNPGARGPAATPGSTPEAPGAADENQEEFLRASRALAPFVAREGLDPERLAQALARSPLGSALGLTSETLNRSLSGAVLPPAPAAAGAAAAGPGVGDEA